MSAKSTKKAKPLSVPRPMAEIQTAYQQLCANAGQLQYQIRIQTRELDRTNGQLEAVNNEAAARQRLDKEKTKPTAASDASATTQSTEASA